MPLLWWSFFLSVFLWIRIIHIYLIIKLKRAHLTWFINHFQYAITLLVFLSFCLSLKHNITHLYDNQVERAHLTYTIISNLPLLCWSFFISLFLVEWIPHIYLIIKLKEQSLQNWFLQNIKVAITLWDFFLSCFLCYRILHIYLIIKLNFERTHMTAHLTCNLNLIQLAITLFILLFLTSFHLIFHTSFHIKCHLVWLTTRFTL